MLKRHSEVIRTTLIIIDSCLIAASWIGAYWIRFHTMFASPQGIPHLSSYLQLVVLITPFWIWMLHKNDLYRLDISHSVQEELIKILRISFIGIISLIGIAYFAYANLSRTVVLLFFSLSLLYMVSSRIVIRLLLYTVRRRGRNLQHVLIIGGGELAKEVVIRLKAQYGIGTRVFGVLTSDASVLNIEGVPVVGDYDSIQRILHSNRIDRIIIALPSKELELARTIADELIDETVDVSLVPDLLQTFRLRSSVEDLDGLAVISVRQSPFVGWTAIEKRAFDLCISLVALIACAPLMIIIGILVRVTSKGPMIFIQERMGLDGRVFKMLKFRTMQNDAEKQSGPVWTIPNDSRRTSFGAFLRSSSLDELPQLWNVLIGEMSLVGPRPERPVFIEQFRKEIPGYMQRHRVKAGLTGWAQIHGWRGNTSLSERIKYDIYYIENWSIGLDVRILFLTVWRGLFHRNAY